MTKLVGILNITPDSFSADGLPDSRAALARLDAMMDEGADVIDIGAESTRPGAMPMSAEDEWQRLAPLMDALKERVHSACFSIDTRHVETAEKALEAGFRWINDVSGGASAMRALAKKYGATLVLMHSLSVPADPKHTLPEACDPVEEVLAWGKEAIAACTREGLTRAQLIIDPGIGFGKTRGQSLALIHGAKKLKTPGISLLFGHSRKSFLAKPADARDAATLEISRELVRHGVDYLRVHDIASHRAMLRGMEAA